MFYALRYDFYPPEKHDYEKTGDQMGVGFVVLKNHVTNRRIEIYLGLVSDVVLEGLKGYKMDDADLDVKNIGGQIQISYKKPGNIPLILLAVHEDKAARINDRIELTSAKMVAEIIADLYRGSGHLTPDGKMAAPIEPYNFIAPRSAPKFVVV